MRSHRIRVVLNSVTVVLVRREIRDGDREETPCGNDENTQKMEAEEATSQGMAAVRDEKKTRKNSPSVPSKGAWMARALISDQNHSSKLQDSEKICTCCFKLPSLCRFVIVALGSTSPASSQSPVLGFQISLYIQSARAGSDAHT